MGWYWGRRPPLRGTSGPLPGTPAAVTTPGGVGRRGRAATPSGRLLLVEGRWSTGGGLAAAEVARLVGTVRQEADVVQLTDPALWGGPVDDERFLVLSRR